jgi:hypothetical protein
LLIAADIIGLDRVMVEAIRRGIARRHGIPGQQVLLAASHTHWGPATKLSGHFSCGAPNVWYLARLEKTVLTKVDEVLENLSPATIEYGAIDFRGIGCSRRFLVNGKIRWAPNTEGTFDGHTPILRIRREGSPAQLLIVGHACHPTSSGQIEQWSPDYPGAMRAHIAAQLPDTKAVFVQGCGGDAKIVHTDPKTGKLVFSADPSRAKSAGQKLAAAVLARLDEGKMTRLNARLRCSLATGTLSYGQRWSTEKLERQAYDGSRKNWLTWNARQFLANPIQSDAFRYDVQVWRVGEQLTILGMEGEICSPWGPVLRSMARTSDAMVIGYANSTTTYVPDARMIREGGYEVLTAQRYYKPAPFTERIDDEVRAIVADALTDIDASPG